MNNFKVINSNTIIRDLEEENKKLKNKIKVLQSKVKTYEADILKGAYDKDNYVYRDNCHCVKCKQQRLNNVKNSEQEQKEVLRNLNYIKSL
jgi:hypothetical protein